MRVAVHVHPGSRRPQVGGSHGDALVVRVSAPAVDGRANQAVLDALAEAFAVAPRQVRLIRGERSRDKLVEIDGADPATLEQLRAGA